MESQSDVADKPRGRLRVSITPAYGKHLDAALAKLSAEAREYSTVVGCDPSEVIEQHGERYG